MAEAIKSPYGNKPKSLTNPVPGKQEQLTADAFLADLDFPAVPAQQEQAAEPSADAFLSDIVPSEEPAPVDAAAEDFPVQEPDSTFGIDTDIKQQLADMPNRIAANIAGDPESVKLTLQKRLGKENVRVKGDNIFFKNPGDKAFRKLDPNTFEIVNDLVADFYKESIQAIGGFMGGTKGAAAGALATGPAAPIGATVGGLAGTALGVAGATAAVDVMGEQTMDVVFDPNKYKNKEQSLKGSLARGAEKTGEYLKVGAEYALLDKVFRGIGNKWAARSAKTKGLRALEEISPTERLEESVRANMQTLDEMKSLGLTKKIQGTDIEVPANQLLPYLPDVQKVAQSVDAEKAFIQAQKEAAENFSEAALNLVEESAGLTKGKLKGIVKSGVPSEKLTSAAEINGLFSSVRRAEGELIGEFRKKAKDTAKKSPLPSPKTSEALKDIFSGLGVRMKEGKLVFPDDDSFAQVLGTDSKAYISGLKADLSKLNDKLLKGGLNVDELIGQSQLIGAKNDGARRIGGQYKSIIGKLSSALRSDSREGIAMVLDPQDAAEYGARMKRFSSISKSMEQLDSYLRDDIGLNTFAKGLVNKGKEGLPNLKAAKEFLLQENPEVYKNLIGEYMEELALKHRDPKKIGGFNTQGMRKDLASLGSEYLDEIFPKDKLINKSLVLRSFDLADQVQKSIIKGSDSQLEKDAKKALGSLSLYHRGVNTVYALMNFGGKDARLLKLLSREGTESFLTEVPKKHRPQMKKTLDAILTISRQNGTLAAINSSNYEEQDKYLDIKSMLNEAQQVPAE